MSALDSYASGADWDGPTEAELLPPHRTAVARQSLTLEYMKSQYVILALLRRINRGQVGNQNTVISAEEIQAVKLCELKLAEDDGAICVVVTNGGGS